LKESQMGILISYYGRHDNNPNMKYYTLRLNDDNIYAGEINDTYRGIVSNIQLKYMYNEDKALE